MTIDKLQKAIAIMNRSGASGDVNVSHDELHLWPMADSFSASEVEELEALGFRMNDEGGFDCFV